jgi:nucleoside-diphosphate-sugar epimerase
MKILITGACGQVGSHITEMLLDRGDEVLGIDNLATGRREHLKDHDNLKVVIDTIADKNLVEQLFAEFKPDVVVHTAASYKDPNDWYNDTLTNCVGGSNIVRASVENEVKRFIYFQTALCYGVKPLQQPIQLDHPKFPANSSYAITKTANEDFIEISGLDFVTFRLANVVGPRNVSGPLPIFYQRLKDGKQCFITNSRRDFVFVKDLAKSVLKACDGIGKGAYHFSSGTDISIKELYDAVVTAMGLEVYPEPELRLIGPDDAPSILLDPSKTFQDFGKIDFTPLQETVSAAISYFKEFGTLGEFTHLKHVSK